MNQGLFWEITFNKARWDKLSNEHKAIIETSSDAMTARMRGGVQI